MGIRRIAVATMLVSGFTLCTVQAAAAENDATTAPVAGDRMDWWRAARFGLFVHWGPVSLKGTEIGWSRGGERRGIKAAPGPIPVEVYDNLYKEFNPEKFDARQWVEIAKSAGMKYMVFTSKHHDGFCMFDSKLTDYKITNSPFKQDIVGELAIACRAADFPLGFYYSPPDWRHPDYRTAEHARYVEYLHGQLRELCTNYGSLAVVWFDGLGGTAQDWDAPRLVKMIRELQPQVIINNRAGLPEDFDTPEQVVGGFQKDRPWESCITICNQWAWKPEDQLKSLQECVRTLVSCAGGDGNLLLNVGPMPTGEIEPRQVERLKQIGDWLGEYGESIYGTRGGPFLPGAWGASTYKGNTLYLHVFEWDGPALTLPPIEKKVVSSTMLGGGSVQVEQNAEGLTVTVAPEHRREMDTVVALRLDGPVAEIAPRAITRSLATGKAAQASNTHQHKEFEPVTARTVRLDILKASEGPTISEFHLYSPKKKPA